MTWKLFLPRNSFVMGVKKDVARQPGDCPHCKIFSRGNPKSSLAFVGTSSSSNEAADQLLDRMIVAMNLQPENVYVCDQILSDPHAVERGCDCLNSHLGAIESNIVVALGESAAQSLLQNKAPISELRGRFWAYRGAKLMTTFHPNFLLSNPGSKRETWEDLKQVAKELGK